MWTEKHRPKSLQEMVGNEEAAAKLSLWLKKWKPGGKAALLIGPPGTGKTTTVHLLAAEAGMQLVELNASDARTKDRMSKKLGEALGSTNLFGTATLIFLDEVDGLAGRADYGAIDFIKDAVGRSSSPVIMAANDPDSDEVRKLARSTTRIEYRRQDDATVTSLLKSIADEEGLKTDGGELDAMARAANGDMRAAINMLQSGLAVLKDEELTSAQSVNEFFGATDERAALRALRSYPGQPREKLRDLFTAVVRSKVHEERRARALDVISKADVVMGRIMRGRDWRLLRYLDPMLASDLWEALGDGGPSYTLDYVPWPLQLRIWNDSKKVKEVAARVGRRLAVSQKGCLVEDMPFIIRLCAGSRFRGELLKSLDLEDSYEDFIVKESARSSRRQL